MPFKRYIKSEMGDGHMHFIMNKIIVVISWIPWVIETEADNLAPKIDMIELNNIKLVCQ